MRTDFDAGDPDVDPYRLLTAVVVPRPIAWVSSLSADGVVNLAPHSFFNVASARPPMVMFTSVRAKDTLRNVLATGEFVVSMATVPLLEAVNNSSARFGSDQSEAAALDIGLEPSRRVAPPRVAASPVAIECTLNRTVVLGDSTVVIGEVVALSVSDEVLVDGHPDFGLMQPLSRLGRNEWGLHAEVVALDRPRRPDDIAPQPAGGDPG